jgi:hypothetical protein
MSQLESSMLECHAVVDSKPGLSVQTASLGTGEIHQSASSPEGRRVFNMHAHTHMHALTHAHHSLSLSLNDEVAPFAILGASRCICLFQGGCRTQHLVTAGNVGIMS